ncbi:superoxide dismutase family protein [Sphingomonas sp.]|jgi:Cu-Zn family superoxide dismutase|uniref:superoxide dismutase family protein n=1 Tax=Sphingomonas sp. TaxID=28214 RepID=UPI002D7E158A|nr:superoxide dismutase family protein [Sphingomonas sp.]HEU0043398.1 superoxide dismutase family protein [Sphingomonas sp.]
MRALTLLLLAVPLAACNRAEPEVGAVLPDGRLATAQLITATGAPAGRATLREVAGGVRVTLDVNSLPTGTHGAHVHTTGRCDAPDFASAGPHWNPANSKHGTLNPQGPHAGDMPNIEIGRDGRGTVGITLAGATLDGMLDADGAAMMVHATADDLQTDPSGNSGARIACGVFAPV